MWLFYGEPWVSVSSRCTSEGNGGFPWELPRELDSLLATASPRILAGVPCVAVGSSSKPWQIMDYYAKSLLNRGFDVGHLEFLWKSREFV